MDLQTLIKSQIMSCFALDTINFILSLVKRVSSDLICKTVHTGAQHHHDTACSKCWNITYTDRQQFLLCHVNRYLLLGDSNKWQLVLRIRLHPLFIIFESSAKVYPNHMLSGCIVILNYNKVTVFCSRMHLPLGSIK